MLNVTSEGDGGNQKNILCRLAAIIIAFEYFGLSRVRYAGSEFFAQAQEGLRLRSIMVAMYFPD